MSILSRLCLAVVLSLSASLAVAQAGAPEPSNVQEQQKRQTTQPGNNAPVWRDVRSGQENYTSIKGRETGVLIQSQGDTWRRIRNGPVTFYGGLLVVLIAAAILAFYSIFGAVKLHEKPTGRLMQRFTRLDQIVHWSVAISFCILGRGGLIMTDQCTIW